MDSNRTSQPPAEIVTVDSDFSEELEYYPILENSAKKSKPEATYSDLIDLTECQSSPENVQVKFETLL